MVLYDTPFSASFHTVRQLSADPLYGSTIVVDSSIQTRLENQPFHFARPKWDALSDAVGHINTMTGQTFTVTNTPPGNGTAIFVVTRQTLLDHGDTWLPPDTVTTEMSQLTGKPEHYLLYSAGAGGLWIVGGGTLGCLHGIYDYLQRLGFDQLWPGDVWIDYPTVNAVTGVVTHLTDITLAVNEVCQSFINGLFWAPQNGYFDPGFANANDGFRQGEDWYKWLIRLGRPYGYNFVSSQIQSMNMQNLPVQAMPDVVGLGTQAGTLRANPTYAANPLLRAMQGGIRLANPPYITLNMTFHDDIATVTVEGTENPTDYTSYNGTSKYYNDFYDANYHAPYYASIGASLLGDPDLTPISTAEPGDGQPIDQSDKSLALLRNGPYPGFNGSSPDALRMDICAHFANRMAVHVAANYPGERVGLYAYGGPTESEHSSVPNIPLHPSITLLVVPDVFCEATPADYQLGLFAADRDNNVWDGTNQPYELAIYQFIALPANQGYGDPRGDIVQWFHKIRYWQDYGVKAFYGESTVCTGPAGHAWYLVMKALWDRPSGDTTAYCMGLLDTWWARAFPTAAVRTLARRSYDRWQRVGANVSDGSIGYSPTRWEYGELFTDLHAAQALVTPGSLEESRLSRLECYAHFLPQLEATRHAPLDQTAREAVYNDILFHAHYSHTFTTLQTTNMDLGFGCESRDGIISSAFKDKWNWGIAHVGGQTWSQRTGVPDPPVSESTFVAQMHSLVATNASGYTSLGLTNFVAANEFDLVTVGALDSSTTVISDNWLQGESDHPLYGGSEHAFLSAGTGTVSFQCYSNTSRGHVRLILTKPDLTTETTILETTGATSGSPVSHSWNLATLGSGLFRVHLDTGRSDSTWSRFTYPRNVPFAYIGLRGRVFLDTVVFTNTGTGTYFWVPPGCTTFTFYNTDPDNLGFVPVFTLAGSSTSIGATEILNPDSSGSRMYSVPVASGNDGKVWRVKSIAPGGWRLYDIPNIWARDVKAMLVPRSLT